MYLSAPLVLIDVLPTGEPEWRAALLRRCAAVLGDAQCALAPSKAGAPAAVPGEPAPVPEPAQEAPPWRALVQWEGESFSSATVQLYNAALAREISSPISFTETDHVSERWASVGLLIAAMVTAHPAPETVEKPPPEPEPEPEPPPTPPLPPTPPPLPPEPVAVPRLDVVGLGSAGLTDERPLIGAGVRLSVVFPARLFVVGAGGFTAAGGDASLSNVRGDIGLGYSLPLGRSVYLEPQLVLRVGRLQLSAKDGSRTDTQTEWQLGSAVGVDLNWRIGARWDLLLGADLALAEALRVQILDEPSGKLSSLRPGLLVGLRFRTVSD